MIDFGDKNDNDEIDLFFFEIFGDSMEEEIVFWDRKWFINCVVRLNIFIE